jgi:hypothetical protein
MKIWFSLTILLLGAIIPSSIEAGYPNPHICETDAAPGIKCHTTVSIECKINATGQNCVNPDTDNNAPFITGVDRDFCQTIPVTIKFKMCNNSNKSIDIHGTDTYVNYIGGSLSIPNEEAPLSPNTCREVIKTDNWDTCRKMRPMSIQLDGRIVLDPADWSNTNQNVYCYCYLYKRATIGYAQEEPIPVDTCMNHNFIITECARPIDATWAGSYIELYNPACANKKIGKDIQLVRIDERGIETNKVPLKGLFVDSNGFVVLCNNEVSGNFIYGPGTCTPSSTSGGGPTFYGKDTFALTFAGDTNIILDVYGNKSPDRIAQNIFDGRCVRKLSVSVGKASWSESDWIIARGSSTTSDMDPRIWNNDEPISYSCTFILTEIANPSNITEARFVEIFSPDCAGQAIPPGYRLVYYRRNSSLHAVDIVLSGQVPDDGILVVCASASGGNVYGSERCDLIPWNAGNNEYDFGAVAIIKCTTASCSSFNTLDIFGYVGVVQHVFLHGGRCYRLASILNGPFNPHPIWIPNEWIIFDHIVLPNDCTPGEWPEQEDGGIEPPPPTEVVVCDARASKFKFRFHPRLCENSDNFVHRIDTRRHLRSESRRSLKKSSSPDTKFRCLESSSSSPPSSDLFRVVIKAKDATETSGNVYLDQSSVEDYDTLTIVGFNGGTITTELNIYIYNSQGSKVQEIMFHSSCSMELSTGDTFGSIELIGFENSKTSFGFP